MKTAARLRTRVSSKTFAAVLFSCTIAFAAGCTKKHATEDDSKPITTYKYDPLKSETAAKLDTAELEPTKHGGKHKGKSKSPSRKPSAIPKMSHEVNNYIVQIGAFTKRENADKLFEDLKNKNYPVFIKTLDHKDFGPMFLVRLQPTTDRLEADRYLGQLKDEEHLHPNIIIPPKE